MHTYLIGILFINYLKNVIELVCVDPWMQTVLLVIIIIIYLFLIFPIFFFPSRSTRWDWKELVFGAERGLKWAALGGQIGRDTAGLLRKRGTEEKERRKRKKERKERKRRILRGGEELAGGRRNAQRSHCERRHLRYYSYKLFTHFRVNAIFFFLLRNSVLVLEHARTHVACDC